MKSLKTLVLTSLLALLASLLVPQKARADVNFSFFYDSLSPYGDWVETDDYGYVWQPTDRDRDWRPYSDGYWAQTDAGWTWVSYEDYGGVVYHYGRWVDLDESGWVWVPGYDWGPGWVSWRSSDNYVGWAPLPPRAQFSVTIGFGGAVDRDYDIGPGYYNFCEVRNFGAPDLRPVIVNREQNITIVNQTTNITNITVNKNTNVVYNGGPDAAFINKRSDRPIQRLNLVRQTDVTAGGKNSLRARKQGNDLVMLAPRIDRGGEAKLAPAKVARRLGKAQVNNGWRNVPDAQRQQLKDKFQADAVRPRSEREKNDRQRDNGAAPGPAEVAPTADTQAAGREKGLNRAGKRDRQGAGQAPQEKKKNGNLQPFLPADQNADPAAAANAASREARSGKKSQGSEAADPAARQERRQQREAQQAQQEQAQEQARAARQAQRQQEAATAQQRAAERPDRADRPPGEARRRQPEAVPQADPERAARQAQRQQEAARAARQADRPPQADRQAQQQQLLRQQQRQAERAQAAGGEARAKGEGEGRKDGKKKKDKKDEN